MAHDPILHAVRKEVRKFEAKFARIVCCAYSKFSNEPVELIRIYLNELSVSLKENAPGFSPETKEIMKQSSLRDIFIHLRQIGAWDFLNFYLLESLAEEFGDDELKAEIKEYTKEITIFKQNTKLIHFVQVWKGRFSPESLPDCDSLVVRLEMEWEECTLADIDKVEGYLASEFQLPRWIFHIGNVAPGSVAVRWFIFTPAAQLILETIHKKKTDLQKGHIQILMIEKLCPKVVQPSTITCMSYFTPFISTGMSLDLLTPFSIWCVSKIHLQQMFMIRLVIILLYT